jgi:uncharacterized surface protein with fasciclin (FAS1) repeats
MNNNSKVAVMLIVGLIIGLVIGYPVGHSHASSNNTNTATTVSSSTDGVTVGGAKMANALNAKNVTTLVTAVKAANLVSTLEGPGPFTVFAPNNSAFSKVPSSTLNSLLQPANQAQLVKILTYHVVPGTYTSAALRVMAEKGQALTSVEGGAITPVLINSQLELKDAEGNLITIQTPDVISSNGVTFVINSVMMP